jgi:hypothetical protein
MAGILDLGRPPRAAPGAEGNAPMTSMLLHDARVHGNTPLNYTHFRVVDEHTPLRFAIDAVARIGAAAPIDHLHVICHGLESHASLGQQASLPQMHGGWGLQLCREGLNLGNAGLTFAWRCRVRRIVLFACAAADTAPGNAGTQADGRRFCGELAIWSGAEVIAPLQPQVGLNYLDRCLRAHPGYTQAYAIRMGEWEGPVLRFTPQDPEGHRIVPLPHDPTRLSHL